MDQEYLSHDHTFGQDQAKPGERRTLIVIALTALTMGLEITTGVVYGSMALLADGLHMGSHALALGITALAYLYTRRHASDERFTFGTGKINSLAAFASAILLVVFALVMVWESVHRIIEPIPISFNQAILVAVIGLAVNGASLLILRGRDHGHGHSHSHGLAHSHDHGQEHQEQQGNSGRAAKIGSKEDLQKDHNLWSAYLHVMADALTSFLAIFALLAGKYYGLNWLDPVMGIVGAVLVSNWSLGLIRSSGRVLLDMRAPADIREGIVEALEKGEDDKVVDLHVWAVGPEIYAAEITLLTSKPQNQRYYIKILENEEKLVHITISINPGSTDI